MGLSPHLAVTLFCFLICTGNGIHGCNDSPLREIINTLNQVTEKGVSTLSSTISPDTQVMLRAGLGSEG